MFKRKEDKATKSTLAQNSAATQNFMEITDADLIAVNAGGGRYYWSTPGKLDDRAYDALDKAGALIKKVTYRGKVYETHVIPPDDWNGGAGMNKTYQDIAAVIKSLSSYYDFEQYYKYFI